MRQHGGHFTSIPLPVGVEKGLEGGSLLVPFYKQKRCLLKVGIHERHTLFKRSRGVILVHLGGEMVPAHLDGVLSPAHGTCKVVIGNVRRLHEPLVVIDAPDLAAVVHAVEFGISWKYQEASQAFEQHFLRSGK